MLCPGLLKEGKTFASSDPRISTCVALSRKPTDDELTKITGLLKDEKQKEPFLNDVFWSLLNSKEFVFNH